MSRAVMLFAAGFGTRMGALTTHQPKPLVSVAGRPLIDHALDMIQAADLSKIVVNLHYHGDKLRAHLADRNVQFSEERDILETGGGLRAALPLLGDAPVFTSNSDAMWQGPNPFQLLEQAWDPDRMDGLLMLVPQNAAIGHTGKGDFLCAEDGRLVRGPGPIYTGVQIIKTDHLAAIPQTAFSLNVLWDEMLAQQRLFGLVYPGEWCDIGRPEGIVLAERMIGHVV